MYESGCLMHYGRKGMRWGMNIFQHPYQNPDGTLTPKGRARYSKMGYKISEDGTFTVNKKIGSMTDKELQSAINRLNLEKQYTQLIKDLTPKRESRAKKYIDSIVKNGATTLSNAAINALAKKIFGSDGKPPQNNNGKKPANTAIITDGKPLKRKKETH